MNYENRKTDTTLYDGRYKIIRELGQGGFGVTYLVSDIKSGNSHCVLKKLNPQLADLTAAKKLFYREAKVLERLQNNHQIPQFIGYFEERGDLYIVEEYVEGIPLNEMTSTRWSREDIIYFLQQILSILSIIHEQNIVHRDIKPSNIIKRKENGQLVLIDFGAVKLLEQDQFPHQQKQIHPTLIISRGYSPPEQIEGLVGFYCDIYALGITAIQLLTGIHPVDLSRDEDDNVIFPDSILTDLNYWLINILQKMVYLELDKRYQSVNEVQRDLSTTQPQTSSYKDGTRLLDKKTGKSENQIQSSNINDNNNNKQQELKYLGISSLALVSIASFTAIVEFTNPFIRPWYHLNQGNKLLDERQPKAALDKFEKVIEIQPKSAEAWKGRGDALFILRRNSGALASYNRAIYLKPQDIQTQIKIFINKGKIRYNERKYEEALENYEEALKINSQQAEAWSGKGLALLGLGKYSEAKASFRKVEAIKPNDPKIWQEIGFAVENLQGTSAAKKYFEEALETYGSFLRKKPDDVISWTDRGGVLLKLNRFHEALDSFQRALNIDKNFHEALIGKGNSLANLRQYHDAVSAYDMALANRPQDYQVWLNRGFLMLQDIKNYQEALRSFNKSIEYRNDSYLTWVGKGLALLHIEGSKQNLNDALAAFNEAKELNPKDPNIWDYRAETLRRLGQFNEAQRSKQKAKELR